MNLELKHILAYADKGLKLRWLDGKLSELDITIDEIDYILNKVNLTLVLFSIKKEIAIKPILRPLSDLTKLITHNGETFVPLLELFKLINDYHLVDFNINYAYSNIEYQVDDEWNHCMTFNDIDLIFGYDENDKLFHLMQEFKHYSFNCFEMYDKLYEWKFDIYSLIENQLAIAVTDELNPYK